MKCKACHNTIPDGSIFCNLCGERQVKQRKKKGEIKVPVPKQLPSGTWWARVTVGGERVPVSGRTEAEYYAKAKAVKIGLVDVQKQKQVCTLEKAEADYLASVDNTFPPSTLRGWETCRRNRFKTYKQADINDIPWQVAVNNEAALVSAHTVSNAWDFIKHVLRFKGIDPPKIRLPVIVPVEGDFLDYEQIKTFLAAIHGDSCELAMLLALHSLRQSELLDLDVTDISNGEIHVRGATVQDKNNKYVHKEANKNRASRRDIPIMIDRVYELLPESGKVITAAPNTVYTHVTEACRRADLPVCSLHDLRRSFASLCYHLGIKEKTTMKLGGWSHPAVVQQVYQKLATQDYAEDTEKLKAYFAKMATEMATD